jgi:hypothetical protein
MQDFSISGRVAGATRAARNAEMHSTAPRFGSHAFVIFVAGLLAGCDSGPNAPLTQAVGFAQSASQVGPSRSLGFVDTRKAGTETIDGSARGGMECPPSPVGFMLSVSVSGAATGPYPGAFIGSATAPVICTMRGKTNVSGAFTITSGTSAIKGSFSGDGTYICDRGCRVLLAHDVAYEASLNRVGRASTGFSGHASGNFANLPDFVESLAMKLHAI